MNLLVDRNLVKRRAEIPKAETIVEHEVEAFVAWRGSLAAAPIIKRLRERVEELRSRRSNGTASVSAAPTASRWTSSPRVW
jgi:glutamyl-tRNA reductase